MLPKCTPMILLPLSLEEALETVRPYSSPGMRRDGQSLMAVRRRPHGPALDQRHGPDHRAARTGHGRSVIAGNLE